MSDDGATVQITVHETVELRKFDGDLKPGEDKQPVEIIQLRDEVRTIEVTADEAARLRG